MKSLYYYRTLENNHNHPQKNELEEIIAKSTQYSYLYARDILKGRFEKGEEAISKFAWFSYFYAIDVLKGPFELGEETISKNSHYRNLYIKYAYENKSLDIDAYDAYQNLKENSYHFQKDELEEIIATSAYYSCLYATYILRGRFHKGEEAIATNDYESYLYAKNVLKGRFKKGEKVIWEEKRHRNDYIKNVYDPYSNLIVRTIRNLFRKG